MEQRIKNIVFDIGGVLADFRIKEFLSEKGFDGAMIRRILKASVMSPTGDNLSGESSRRKRLCRGSPAQTLKLRER